MQISQESAGYRALRTWLPGSGGPMDGRKALAIHQFLRNHSPQRAEWTPLEANGFIHSPISQSCVWHFAGAIIYLPALKKVSGLVASYFPPSFYFVGWERDKDNAKKVEAAKIFLKSSPIGGGSLFGSMLQQTRGQAKLEPGGTTFLSSSLGSPQSAGLICMVMASN